MRGLTFFYQGEVLLTQPCLEDITNTKSHFQFLLIEVVVQHLKHDLFYWMHESRALCFFRADAQRPIARS
ncbi:hypothetical protein BJF95_00205 [Rhizobium oryziradicis]|uniref:Uncharacterized protein n=1 Tax=Rhizobium oryziradicis TaxID=1867956 RepID=A0A1Q8ZLJ0_9HYPH|nr:hypothetical protein BJF95_00205 [Rhizobium oryziradicis]